MVFCYSLLKGNKTKFQFIYQLKKLRKPSMLVLFPQFLDHCKQSLQEGGKFLKKRMKKVRVSVVFHVIKWKIAIFCGYYGWQSCSVWPYITLMISQCIIFIPNQNDSFSFRRKLAQSCGICSYGKMTLNYIKLTKLNNSYILHRNQQTII